SIADYGATPNDQQPDTRSIQAAINACKGTGGSVIVPAGIWNTGGIELGSNMEFHLRAGAELRLIPDISLYPKIEHDGPRSDGPRKYYAAIYAPGVSNLIIRGPGKINGSGPAFWDENFYDLGIGRPTLPRPEPTVELSDCNNVHVRGVQFENLPSFALKFNRCDNVSAVDVRIENDRRSPNTDGIQITDTKNAFITRANIRTGDDAIVIKSYRRTVDNLVVSDSYLESDDGAIKFGTQVYKGIQNATFSNIVINESRYGISLFQYDGGYFRNNRFDNIIIKTGGRWDRHYPIYVDVDRRTTDSDYGQIDGLVFSNISIDTSGASLIAGHPKAPIRNLTLQNINVTTPDKVFDLTKTGNKPSGNKDIRRDSASENYASVPAHFVLGNAEHVVMKDIVIDDRDERLSRSALALIGLEDVVISDITVDTSAKTILQKDVQRIRYGRVSNFAVGD
ncbi:MAG: glycosyl hydrolase family 28 protein, partial [Pseudomonadota bacterium]